MPKKRPAKDPERSPRGLLDSIENLGEARRKKRDAKAKPANDLDLDRIG